MVAPSFQNFEILCEPFEEKGKMYIKVRNPKTKTERKVRFYTETEFHKLYPEVEITGKIDTQDKYYRPLRDVLGFEKGFITIFKGEIDEDIEEYFKLSPAAQYSTRWGWYIPSSREIPADLPSSVEPITLSWELVGQDKDTLKPKTQIDNAIGGLVYEAHPSQFVGTVGERIEIKISVVNNIRVENDYGVSNIMVFEDDSRNQYVWIAASKSWAIGVSKTIRGTIKSHKTFRGINQTVLTRCMER